MIRFQKGEMKRRLEETMEFLQNVEDDTAQEMNDKKLSKQPKNS